MRRWRPRRGKRAPHIPAGHPRHRCPGATQENETRMSELVQGPARIPGVTERKAPVLGKHAVGVEELGQDPREGRLPCARVACDDDVEAHPQVAPRAGNVGRSEGRGQPGGRAVGGSSGRAVGRTVGRSEWASHGRSEGRSGGSVGQGRSAPGASSQASAPERPNSELGNVTSEPSSEGLGFRLRAVPERPPIDVVRVPKPTREPTHATSPRREPLGQTVPRMIGRTDGRTGSNGRADGRSDGRADCRPIGRLAVGEPNNTRRTPRGSQPHRRTSRGSRCKWAG